MKRLLAIGDFRKLWLSHVISSFGDALTNLALLILAQRLTGSTAAVATTAVAVALPQLLFGLFAGVLVDRWDRKRVMIASDLARAFLVLGFLAVGTPDRMWLLYAVAFVQASIGTLDNPARSAVLPQIVGKQDLLAANSFFQSTIIIVGVAGTAAAGVIAGLFDSLALAFVIDAASFALSAVIVARIAIARSPSTATATKRPGTGTRHVAGSPNRPSLHLLVDDAPDGRGDCRGRDAGSGSGQCAAGSLHRRGTRGTRNLVWPVGCGPGDIDGSRRRVDRDCGQADPPWKLARDRPDRTVRWWWQP